MIYIDTYTYIPVPYRIEYGLWRKQNILDKNKS